MLLVHKPRRLVSARLIPPTELPSVKFLRTGGLALVGLGVAGVVGGRFAAQSSTGLSDGLPAALLVTGGILFFVLGIIYLGLAQSKHDQLSRARQKPKP